MTCIRDLRLHGDSLLYGVIRGDLEIYGWCVCETLAPIDKVVDSWNEAMEWWPPPRSPAVAGERVDVEVEEVCSWDFKAARLPRRFCLYSATGGRFVDERLPCGHLLPFFLLFGFLFAFSSSMRSPAILALAERPLL
jgi:hypothetical protein